LFTTDVSHYAIGDILNQGKIDLSIAYIRHLNSAEQKYSTIEKELLVLQGLTQYFIVLIIFDHIFMTINLH